MRRRERKDTDLFLRRTSIPILSSESAVCDETNSSALVKCHQPPVDVSSVCLLITNRQWKAERHLNGAALQIICTEMERRRQLRFPRYIICCKKLIVRVHYFVRGGFVGYRSRASSKHLSSHLPVGSLDSSGGSNRGCAVSEVARVGVESTKKPTPDVVVVFET
ncbi:hypothetical protein TNCV_2055211 [Trichonephila clavipes]|uniref:Uncharacterized protein n=1 Tax=Trichonephila clavipes TaxID=2585209 RepID=A0A8X6V7Y2_TRICX|nr:hypothetical protein TNCV_2055211 [Trichonephila clavipes]